MVRVKNFIQKIIYHSLKGNCFSRVASLAGSGTGSEGVWLKLLGFDHEKFTYRYAGRDFRLTDVHGKVVSELIA